MAGQTINDRLLAARHSLAGQGLAKSVCKATTEEMIGPKKKHLDYLVQCTNEPNVSIPQLANLLIERSQNANWVVVYKALITTHHMMCYGNERFTQYLASSNSSFQLSNFLDKSSLQGVAGAKVGYDMSPFIRRYARYINEKALSYRTVAFDFCKVKRGKEDGMLRTMNADKLLKTLPSLQNQLDSLLEFDCSPNNLTNGVINMCFMLLFRDLIRLFACYNDGVINLLEKFFDMNKKQCRDALDLYKKFLIRMDRVGEFLKVAENVGIDKGDIPDLTKAPSSLLDALEQHLASVEGKKSNATSPTQNASNQRNIKSGVTALSSTSNSFGTAATNGRLENNGIDESLKQQVLAEEEAAMNQYKSKVQSPNNATNPFLNSPPAVHAMAAPVDLFAPPVKELQVTKASDDLLQLNNPFADVFGQQQPVPLQTNMWMTNGNGFAVQPQIPVQQSNFVTESNFNSVFGATESTAAKDCNVYGSTAALNPFLSDIPEPILLLDSTSEIPIIDLFGIDNIEQKLDNPLLPVENVHGGGGSGDFIEDGSSKSTSPVELKAMTPGDERDLFTMGDKTPEAVKPKAVPPPRPPPPVVKPPTPLVESPEKMSSDTPNPETATIPVNINVAPLISPLNISIAPGIVPNVPPVQLIDGVQSAQTVQNESQFPGFDGLGGVLQPATSLDNSNGTGNKTTNSTQGSALLTGDLESSLASLAENLSINSRAPTVKGVQWNSPKNGAKSGSSWTPQPMAATTGAGYRPMGQGMTTLPTQPMYPQIPTMGMRPMQAAGMMAPMSAIPPTTSPMAQQQSLLFH